MESECDVPLGKSQSLVFKSEQYLKYPEEWIAVTVEPLCFDALQKLPTPKLYGLGG